MNYYVLVKGKIRNCFNKITLSKKLFDFNGKVILVAACIFFGFTLFHNIYESVGPVYLLSRFFIYSTIVFLIAIIGSIFIKVISKFSWVFRVAGIFVIISVVYFYPGLVDSAIWILVCILIIFPSLFASGLYLIKNSNKKIRKRKALGTFLACSGLLGVLLSVYLIFIFQGIKTDMPSNIKTMGALPPPINASNPAKNGDFQVSHLSYGSGKDEHRGYFGSKVTIETESVDATGIMKSWDGLFGKLRSYFFGFDAHELPLNALVWYPKNAKRPLPLIIIVHGNHQAEDFSEDGYAYLAELLASRGYIVASVDENFLNISATEIKAHLTDENAARGWLLLKHLQLWRNWNKDPTNEFYQKVDMNNIALIGHSRGGEAIGHAALFNKLPNFPDDATQIFDFNFNIKSLIAIAPVDGQYKPGKALTTLKDVCYLVLQGSQDMDMKSYGGLAAYHRVKFSRDFQGFKAGLYIKGANHGQFNSGWGRYDQLFPAINQYNVKQIIDQQKQQKIAKVYISAFLDVTLKGNQSYKPLFMDYRYGREWLPENMYFNQFEESGTTYIANFEEDLNVGSTSLPGGNIKTENLTIWKEQKHILMWNGSLTNAAYIGWGNLPNNLKDASYTIILPDSTSILKRKHSLIFSLAQSDEEPSHKMKTSQNKYSRKTHQNVKLIENKENKSGIDFTIRLEDIKGEKIDFSLSDCSLLYPPIQKNLYKFSFLGQGANSESVPDFFYFDIDKLSKRNNSFSIDQLKFVRFIFNKTPSGVIILDDVGFMIN